MNVARHLALGLSIGILLLDTPAALASVIIPGVDPATVKTYTVSSATALASRLKALNSPAIINLKTGSYGALDLRNFHPKYPLVIRSQQPSKPATFDAVWMLNVSNVRLDALNLREDPAYPTSIGKLGVAIQDGTNIAISNSNIFGTLNDDPNDDEILASIRNTKGLLLFNNRIQQGRLALALRANTNGRIYANRIHDVREGINFDGVTSFRVEANHISDVVPNDADGDHADALQVFWGVSESVSKDLFITGNALILDGGRAGGLHVRNATNDREHQKIRVSHNVIYAGTRRALWFEDTTAIVAERNTIVTAPGWTLEPAIFTRRVRNTLIRQNMSPLILTEDGGDVTTTNNLDLDDSKSTGQPTAQSQLSGNVTISDPPIANFKVASGSIAAQMQAGAKLPAHVGGVTGTAEEVEAVFQEQWKAVLALP